MNAKQCCLAITIVFITVAANFVGGWQSQKNVIAKWEYTIGKCDQADLNEKGNEGWEMVGAAEVNRGIACCCKVFYKRPKR
jgi:hypothetical protein